MKTPVICAILLLLAQPQAGAQTSFVLKDQYGKQASVGTPTSGWTVIVYGDREGSNYESNWTKGLKTIPNCRIVYAANLHSVPFFMKGTVTGKFVGPKKGPVLLDWEGQIGRAFGHTPSVANVYAFDPSGKMRARDSGKGNESELQRFITVLTTLTATPPL
jgi:hypothetical protein